MGCRLDSCALRVCMGLNGSKYTIDGKGKRYFKGANGKRHLLGAQELFNHIKKDWGAPDLSFLTVPEGGLDWSKDVKGKCALVFYVDVTNGVTNAIHTGFIKNQREWNDAYGGTDQKALIYFIPCTCKIGTENVCAPCKEFEELYKLINPSSE